ncbi:GNAT family N-acetyltransferase [Paenibacillaceae bacterium]|nr:GNAT family N-acetyltransferase [Paenibacillaceae bacterium]
MKIRTFDESDIAQIVLLFYETVHAINKQDYTQEQLDAWAPKDEGMLRQKVWTESMCRNITYVAENNSEIVGFADMTSTGHLDRLYIHKNFQRQGIASALVNTLETAARSLRLTEMSTEASITAKPFFECLGFQVVQRQVIERRGIELVNFRMKKYLDNYVGK